MRESVEQVDLNDLAAFIVNGQAGESLYRQGDAGTELYLIRHGEFELRVRNARGATRTERLGSGDFFGELSIFDEARREGDAVAITDFQLLRIDRDAFHRMVIEDPQIAVGMLRQLSRRLRRHQHPAFGAVLVEVDSRLQFSVRAAGPSTIGRQSSQGGARPDIDLSAVDKVRSLSRAHAVIQERDGEYLLTANKTLNGTFVNGASLPIGSPVALREGDRITLGGIRLIFRAC